MSRKNHLIVYYIAATAFVLALLSFQSCKRSRSDIGQALFKESENKVYKQIEADVLAERIEALLEESTKRYKNPKFLSSAYQEANYEPVLLLHNFSDGNLKKAVEKLSRADEHGLRAEQFDVERLQAELKQLYDKNGLSNLKEAYDLIAQTELDLANAFTNYSNALQFGLVSPRRIYQQYYTETKRPDSASFNKVFENSSINDYLQSIQPSGKAYKKVQESLKKHVTLAGLGADDSRKALIVALERLRWQNKPTANKYVWVNIPNFSLDVMEDGKSVMNMEVCVGEGRPNGEMALKEYDEGLNVDRPFSRETPQLNSLIHSVQVNPIWNIPESIANKEIVKYAASDPYYLENKGIDVYENGEKVEDPETIDWGSENVSNYKFKQRPGEENSLGKIKFLFDNQNSVYLHDTPAKAAFSLQNRAVSHGCVRVERPLDLARALFGEGKKLNTIASEMQSANPQAKDIALPKKVPVYLAYQTIWLNGAGQLKHCKDVYGLDAVLYSYLQKM